MSIFDTFNNDDIKITREVLRRDGWIPTSKTERTWQKRNIPTDPTKEKGLIPFVHFKYTFRDPHKKIRNILYCEGPFWMRSEFHSNIKTMEDLNVYMTSYINRTNYITINKK